MLGEIRATRELFRVRAGSRRRGSGGRRRPTATMECRDYRDLAAADADGRLHDEERVAAQEHVEACPGCAAVRQAQLDVKRLVRDRCTPQPASDLLRASVKRSLASVGDSPQRAAPTTLRRVVIAGAIAATILLSLLPGLRSSDSGMIPLLAADIAQAEAVSPEVRTASVSDLASYYAGRGLDFENAVEDLEPHGFHLVGGSTASIGDVKTTLTVYESGEDRLLCRRFRAADFEWPQGGKRIGDSRVYSHDGVHVSLTRLAGDVICAMTSRLPPARFVTASHSDH